MSNGDPKTLFGFVNVAHSDFGGNASYAVRWAQENGFQGAYIPPGTYTLGNLVGGAEPIVIYQNSFALAGAGMEISVLTYSGKNIEGDCAIQVVKAADQITGVRLADFTIRREGTGPTTPPLGGVYLEQAIYTELTRVRSDGWHQAGMEQSFGFKVYSAARDGQAGTIRFTDCRADDNLYGIWIDGVTGKPVNRCMVIGGLYRGAKRTSGEASGGGTDALIDAGTDFEALHVERDDIVANDSDGSWGTVASLGYTSTPEVKDVLNLQDGWHDGETNSCEDGDAYTIFARGGRGINIHNGKSTLVLGSILAGLDYGVYIHPCLDVNGSNETHRAQVIGVKGDNISHYGVYVGQNVYQAQVVAVSQPDPDKALQDEGDGTLVLTHRLARLPATVGIGWEAEQIFHPQHRWLGWKIDDQHVLRVEDGGLLDASIRGQAGCGAVTRSASGPGYTNDRLNDALGRDLPDGFMGVYYDSSGDDFYLVTRANSAWKGVVLTS